MTEFVWPIRVYYEDTDRAGVVYYANYLKFMERARSEYLRSLGFEQDQLIEQDGVIFAVRAIALDYLRPARFNQLLDVTARVAEVGKASLLFAQRVQRAQGDATEVMCEGTVKIACLAADTLRPTATPPRLRHRLMEVTSER